MARRGRKRGTIVLGAVAGEEHGLAGAILADLIRGAGFDVIDLGANSPADSFVDAARGASRLVAVVVGAITSGRDAAVKRAVAELHRSGVTAAVLVGGPGIDDEEHARRLGADGWTGHDARRAVGAIESAIESSRS
jgi:methanogenic corrinoid protein MtbC1